MADEVAPLASLSLTHVYYNPNDPLSYLCAWLALVPQALCVVYATLLWSTREAEVAIMFAGQLACEAANFLLKRLIKEERPRRIHATGKGYGMPSSHAQFAVFWAVALALFLLVRHRPRRSTGPRGGSAGAVGNGGVATTTTTRAADGATENGHDGRAVTAMNSLAAIERYTHQPWSLVERVLASVAALVLAGAVAWSRIYLGYHTPRQVLVGCLAGAVCAVGWFGVTSVVRQTGLLAWALEIPVARWFRVRDLVVEEDLCQAGWEKWEGRRVAAKDTAKRTAKKKAA